MLNFDVTFERIHNGFLVTNNKTEKGEKYFYPTLHDFLKAHMRQPASEIDENFKRHEMEGATFTFSITTDFGER